MPITCPCGKKVATAGVAPGRSVTCPACGRSLTVRGKAAPTRPADDPLEDVGDDVAEVVRAGRTFCRFCWKGIDEDADVCDSCGTVVKPIAPRDVREARDSLAKLRSMRNRAFVFPILAAALAFGLGPLLTLPVAAVLVRWWLYVCLGLAGTFSGLWGLSQFLNQDSKLRQNHVLRRRLARVNLLVGVMNALSFFLVIGVSVLSVALFLRP